MSSMTSLSEAHQEALEARKKMLDARAKDTMPPLPDKIVPQHAICIQYFKTAAFLYGVAANAYSAGDFVLGQMYEASAYQHLLLGQACMEQT
jgi:hypothetical protein